MNKENIINIAVGLVVIFGTTYLISKAWKLGQKDKKTTTATVSDSEIEEEVEG
jgi:hypothetical protein